MWCFQAGHSYCCACGLQTKIREYLDFMRETLGRHETLESGAEVEVVSAWQQAADRPNMFGVTALGSANGIAAYSLSIFNVDHPHDRCWLKKCFDTVVQKDAKLGPNQVKDFLTCFYRSRFGGPSLSGYLLESLPSEEVEFLTALAENLLTFEELIAALEKRQAEFSQPAPPLEYKSSAALCNDKVRHVRVLRDPQQIYRRPATTAQEVGWEAGKMANPVPVGKPFHLRTSATTQYMDAVEKQTFGRSIIGEFSQYAARKLLENGGMGMGI